MTWLKVKNQKLFVFFRAPLNSKARHGLSACTRLAKRLFSIVSASLFQPSRLLASQAFSFTSYHYHPWRTRQFHPAITL